MERCGLKKQKARSVDQARIEAGKLKNLLDFESDILKLLHKEDFDPCNVYNLDETMIDVENKNSSTYTLYIFLNLSLLQGGLLSINRRNLPV